MTFHQVVYLDAGLFHIEFGMKKKVHL